VREAKVMTVSDSVASGGREDRTGPRVVAFLEDHGFVVVATEVVPDGLDSVADALRSTTTGFHGLVVTAGGTGFAPSDLTPEGTGTVLERSAPGLAEAMRAVNPLGRLSRGVAGTTGSCLVVNVPGSPTGAVECLGAVIDALPHALELLGGGRPH
jgi:molybdenum cofactor synthesis domain-containing protein